MDTLVNSSTVIRRLYFLRFDDVHEIHLRQSRQNGTTTTITKVWKSRYRCAASTSVGRISYQHALPTSLPKIGWHSLLLCISRELLLAEHAYVVPHYRYGHCWPPRWHFRGLLIGRCIDLATYNLLTTYSYFVFSTTLPLGNYVLAFWDFEFEIWKFLIIFKAQSVLIKCMVGATLSWRARYRPTLAK